MNITIVGFMGTGKTVVAKELARRLRKKYISTDEVIEKSEGIAISDIFARKGESHFRKLEAALAKDLSAEDNLIIDAGGGVVLNEENITNLKKNGIIVCLAATADVIYERTKDYKHRPLLNVPDPKRKIRELLISRSPYYQKADHQVDTSQKTIPQVVNEIIALAKS